MDSESSEVMCGMALRSFVTKLFVIVVMPNAAISSGG